MALTNKKWQVAPLIPGGVLQDFRAAGVHPLIAQVLYNRGVESPDHAERDFFSAREIPDPFLLPDMDKAVTRLREAIRKGELIIVCGDYDVDGITATALMCETLASLGARVGPYIPTRAGEGYGLSLRAVDEFAERGCRLIITVDTGIRSNAEAERAREHSIDMIITDHHSAHGELPPAVACVNPKREDSRYPFADLSGVGVAYKLAQALLRSHSESPIFPDARPIPEADLLDLVALGTVADLAPLRGENRALVLRGVQALRHTRRPGLQELIATSCLRGPVTVDSIGYILGPRLNAAGRLDTAMDSYHLLTTRDREEAIRLSRKLEEYNRERQRLTMEAIERTYPTAQEAAARALLLFVADPEIPEGIAGLVATRLVEEFYRPAIVIQKSDGVSRGSARSVPEWNITQALDRCSHLLVRHGGHAAAAGFEVETHRLDALRDELLRMAHAELAERVLTPTLIADAEVQLRDMTWAFQRELARLEPFGYDNPAPVFVCRNVRIRDSRIVGEKHLKLSLSDGQMTWDAIAFKQADRASGLPHLVDVAFSLEINSWNGQDRLQLNVRDIGPAGGPHWGK
ncbi:MAG: single-stranded-DNA-specific exonuclease RecJ [Anaerolineae bacterium]|nr:single-stranded-DNA-specific exonuclease RecJ [Anaerolineae bacterium]